MKTIKREKESKEDRKIENMIANWDKIRCYICNKEISMLDAILIEDEFSLEHFVCKECKKYV